MRRRYIRLPAERKHDAAALMAAGAVAACAGAVTFYLTRLFLAREVVGPDGERPGLPAGEERPALPAGENEEHGGGRE